MAKLNDLYSTKLADITSAETLCEIARPLIQAKARRLIRRPEFVIADQEDVEQEAFVRLLDRFAAGASGDFPVLAFIERIVNQSIANQVRERIAKKRDPRSVRSLNTSVGNTSPRRELGDAISQVHLDARLGRLSRYALDLVALGMDLEETLAELSQEQQELCKALRIESIGELAERLQVPPTTLKDKVRKLRRVLEDRDLQEYVQ